MTKNVIDHLLERGFIDTMTGNEVRDRANSPQKVYCGFDPTSDSLHLGNLVAIMGLAWFQRMGHTPVVLVGGATGMIGDPSGKKHERLLLDEEKIAFNLAGIEANLRQILDFNDPKCTPIVVNNFDWINKFTVIEFLRDVGKHFRLGPMLSKESVRQRLASEEGMSFTEFSYQLLQAYDFLHLYQEHGVTMQLGGSDQWGNITAGTDLIRKVLGKHSFGITFPLLTRSDGQKFGKSEKGAIWLSADKVSPYEFYQYLFRVADDDVITLMRMLTFMEMEEIVAYEKMMKAPGYVPNTVQKRLAEEVTRIVHGEKALETALKVTVAAAPGSATALDGVTLEAISKDMPNHKMALESVLNVKLLDLVVDAGLMQSKGDVRRLIRNGGAYLNNERVDDENCVITESFLIDGHLLLVALGKKNKVLIRIDRK